MKNIYYTPESHEFIIGFKYESANLDCHWNQNGWTKKKVTENTNLKVIKDFPFLHRALKMIN